MIKENKYIDAFDALRILAMLFVFINHIWAYLPIKIPDFGARGVEIFFLLSGFLTYYSFSYKVEKRSLRITQTLMNGLKFYIRKYKKFILLHCITLAAMLYIQPFKFEIFLPNILLLQSWIPKQEIYWGYNGVSWFLSSILFCYIAFYICFQIINYKFYIKFSILLLLILSPVKSFISTHSDLTGYLFYIFPIYNFVIFSFGCILCIIYKQIDYKISKIFLFYLVLVYLFSIVANLNRFYYIIFEALIILSFALYNNTPHKKIKL